MKSLKQYLSEVTNSSLPLLTAFVVVPPNQIAILLVEGKWVKGRFDNSIRIDQPTHMQGNGKTHAHLFARNGDQYGIVNLDGTASHGVKCKIHPNDAAALVKRNFKLPPDNIVEWVAVESEPQFLIKG